MRFDELDLEDEILDGLEDMNFHEMTPVQEHTIPVILEGRDIIGCAQTGTGKTAAYTLPLLNKLLLDGNPDNVVKSLIIASWRSRSTSSSRVFPIMRPFRRPWFTAAATAKDGMSRKTACCRVPTW